MTRQPKQEWLLIFYSVPSHPVSSRMKIWRKLAKTGAVQLKGAVYILPSNEEHQELCQWLIGEVKAMGGDGAFARTTQIETMDDDEVRALFSKQIETDYRGLDKQLDAIEQTIQSVRKGTKLKDKGRLTTPLTRLKKEYGDMNRRDFFSSPRGRSVEKRLQQIESAVQGLDRTKADKEAIVLPRRTDRYQGLTWITRKNPFVDRMASAWLIKRFIDPNAAFRFIEEKDLGTPVAGTTAFDMRGAEFTHVGDLCTFEVLVKTFGIKDRSVKKIAELVHDLDLKDDKYGNRETGGVEGILSGIRKSGRNDADILEKGMAVFELLYQSKL